MTQHPDLFAALAAPFETHEVKVRNAGGRQCKYITARTVMNRLDNVLGPENWWNESKPVSETTWLCKLSIRLPDGQVVTKTDAGGNAGMADDGDDDKSGASDSLKRAAVLFGIGRSLYGDGAARFEGHDVSPPAPARNGKSNGHTSNYEPPRNAKLRPPTVPRNGKELWAWAGDQGVRDELVAWGKRMEFPSKMIDWDPQEVADGHAEGLELLNVSRRRN